MLPMNRAPLPPESEEQREESGLTADQADGHGYYKPPLIRVRPRHPRFKGTMHPWSWMEATHESPIPFGIPLRMKRVLRTANGLVGR